MKKKLIIVLVLFSLILNISTSYKPNTYLSQDDDGEIELHNLSSKKEIKV